MLQRRERVFVIAAGCVAVVAIGVALLVAGLAKRQSDILLITVDTLRLDAWRAHGDNEIAGTSTVYDRAFSPMPLTRPAIFSIHTGGYPRDHGVVNNSTRLPGSAVTLAERLVQFGYQNGAFVGVRLLNSKSGAGQGFAAYEYPRRARQQRADRVVHPALSWLRRANPSQPVFLWVHLVDPRQPYDPPRRFRRGPGSQLQQTAHWKTLDTVAAANDGNIPLPVLNHVLRLYRGEVEYTALWIGRLLAGFDKVRSTEDALVILAADHGECFEDGIYFEHADCMLEGALHVPLVVHFPLQDARARVKETVSLVDIAPTILEAAGIHVDELAGVSLADTDSHRMVLIQQPMFEQVETCPRLRVIESVAGQPVSPLRAALDVIGVVGDGWKYLRIGIDGEELYRVPSAQSGERNVAKAEPRRVKQMREELETLLEDHPLQIVAPRRINRELRQALEASGDLR